MINRYKTLKDRRKARVRNQIRVAAGDRPRLIVTRSNLHIYAQIIDASGKVLAASSDKAVTSTDKKAKTKTERAQMVGAEIATVAKKAKVTKVAFDRGYYKYQGRVKALAESARAQGLEF